MINNMSKITLMLVGLFLLQNLYAEIDLTWLTPQQKKLFAEETETSLCTCGCGMKLSQCLREDETCSVGPKLAQSALDRILSAEPGGEINHNSHARQPGNSSD